MSAPQEALGVSDLARVLANRHRLGNREEILRQLRYFTADELLETVGSVHTGSGRKRLYPPSALIKAVLLLRLFQSGASVGLMKKYMKALEAFIRRVYKTKDLSVACSRLLNPVVYLELPDGRHGLTRVRLAERDAMLDAVKPNVDFMVIQVGRFL
jgi:hypothetical protein